MESTAEAVATSIVKSRPAKFYNFFKFTINDLVKIVPAVFTDVKIVAGDEGKVGCTKFWKYNLVGVPMSAKVELTALDDAGFSITYTVVEGDLKLLYKSFALKLAFSDGSAKCTIAYEKATPLSPPPDAYVAVVITIFTLLDAFLLLN